ncbi:MAG: hypothetical protein KDC46_02310 [Thermoleophilia bacterium]|nr:hypothetical protein [Thermoleophilia bacterium]
METTTTEQAPHEQHGLDRHHLAWGILGAVSIPALWYAWSLPGAVVMFACIGAAFVLWNRLGSRGAWVTLIVLGLGMGGLLGWEAVTGSRCPADGTKVYLAVGKPAVGCDEMRASAASMAMFFLLIGGIGIGAPLYARSVRDETELDELEA